MAEADVRGPRALSLRRAAVVLGAPVLALVALGCGVRAAPETEITEAVERAATSSDPSYCREAVTLAFLEQRSGYEGEAALVDCLYRSGDSGGLPTGVQVGEVRVDGDVATAAVVHEGGYYDGATLRVRLVDDGEWRVDRLLAIEDFDRRAYLREFLASLRAPPFEVDDEAARCFADHVRSQSRRELVSSQIDFDPREATATAVHCDRENVERLAVETFAHPSYDLDPEVLDCAEAALASAIDSELARIYADPEAQTRMLGECGDAAD